MRERGTVIAVHGDRVDVVLGQTAACAGCHACSSLSLAGGEMLLAGVVDRVGVSVGDEVEVEIPERLRLQAALAIYVVPLVALFAGYAVGSVAASRSAGDPDTVGALVGFGSATMTLAAVFFSERELARKEGFVPFVRAIIAPVHIGSGDRDLGDAGDRRYE